MADAPERTYDSVIKERELYGCVKESVNKICPHVDSIIRCKDKLAKLSEEKKVLFFKIFRILQKFFLFLFPFVFCFNEKSDKLEEKLHLYKSERDNAIRISSEYLAKLPEDDPIGT